MSLPEPVHEHIVQYLGDGDKNVLESYGASLVVLVEAIPYYEELFFYIFITGNSCYVQYDFQFSSLESFLTIFVG